jgi:hypothetical protein
MRLVGALKKSAIVLFVRKTFGVLIDKADNVGSNCDTLYNQCVCANIDPR